MYVTWPPQAARQPGKSTFSTEQSIIRCSWLGRKREQMRHSVKSALRTQLHSINNVTAFKQISLTKSCYPHADMHYEIIRSQEEKILTWVILYKHINHYNTVRLCLLFLWEHERHSNLGPCSGSMLYSFPAVWSWTFCSPSSQARSVSLSVKWYQTNKTGQ